MPIRIDKILCGLIKFMGLPYQKKGKIKPLVLSWYRNLIPCFVAAFHFVNFYLKIGFRLIINFDVNLFF
jgi:hypothetical protein